MSALQSVSNGKKYGELHEDITLAPAHSRPQSHNHFAMDCDCSREFYDDRTADLSVSNAPIVTAAKQ